MPAEALPTEGAPGPRFGSITMSGNGQILVTGGSRGLSTPGFTSWQEGPHFVGHPDEFPAYMTQGESLAELKESERAPPAAS